MCSAPFKEDDVIALGARIAERLRGESAGLKARWSAATPVRHVVVDGLLPDDVARHLYSKMPARDQLKLKRSLRESKWVGVDVDHYDPAVGTALMAFQQPEVVSVVAEITGLSGLLPDPTLYASGISRMERDDFLNPHIDNSHDGEQQKYRVLNLLYYVSPDWKLANGGNLELWTRDLTVPLVVESRFNRFVIMQTSDDSWHSVQRVVSDDARLCVSNYYFADRPAADHDYRNVTSFRGRPDDVGIKRAALRIDAALLNLMGRLFPILLRRNRHRRKD